MKWTKTTENGTGGGDNLQTRTVNITGQRNCQSPL